MLSLLGTLGLAAALLGSLLLAGRGWRASRGAQAYGLEPAARLMLGGAVISMAALQLALLSNDFSLAYVANNHASTTPFPFNVATAWAALEGSIVLWGLVLAGFTWMVLRRHRSNPDALGAGALAVMGVVAVFFFGLMLTVANPFEVCTEAVANGCAGSSPWPWSPAEAPAEGNGPNPLLQNHLLMAIHPPMLYLGYVGMTVPFAYAIAALALAVPGVEWLRRSHRSTLLAWSFLTVGIVLGGWWAYEVLSWGGYWAWDPVENASLMPWLVATAFLHSALVQRRRGMLQAWNFVLVISTFALTILGTFLTRSGTIQSVHSFTQSAIGPVLLGFLVLVLVGSFTLFSTRSHLVASAPRIDNLVSREGSFLANNLLLTLYAFITLTGTTYPLIVEAFTGTRIGVGEPFFNRLAVPLSFALLLMMGIGPALPWRSAPASLLWERVRGPVAVALAAGIVTALTVTRIGWVVLAVVLGTFVVATAVGVLLQQAERRARSRPGGVRSALEVLRSDPGFWGGQISHAGVVLVALGIAFAANLGSHTELEMSPGESVAFAGHTFTYESPFQRTAPGRTTTGARLTVTRDGSFVASLEPAANYFGNDPTGVATPDALHLPGGDIYVTMLFLDPDDATLKFDTSPMIWLIWLGGGVVAGGGMMAMAGRRRSETPVEPRATADV
ncbi:MAG: cytochrome c biogenesis protein CcsA [Actinobacteria bacterium]|nr:cytochrome c biogenesis protein CcsA [Actinomycetota bacterium]